MTAHQRAPDGPRLQRQADVALLGVAALWGATFVMVKDALADIGPLTFVAFRFSLASLALLPFASPWKAARLTPVPVAAAQQRRDWKALFEEAGAGALVGACPLVG